MDFLATLTALQDSTQLFTIQDVLVTILLSFLLALLISWVYRGTYRGSSYSQSYVHTLVLMAMVVALIMLIIGSNIARAFTLVGALSVVRFRNAIKDTKDVGFIFFAMAIGMACGTRFYFLAIIATPMISFLLWVLFKFNLMANEKPQQLLKIRLPGDLPYATLFDQIFQRYLNRFDLVALETVQAGMLLELVYSIEMKQPNDSQPFLNELSQLNNNQKITLLTSVQEVFAN